MTARQTAITGRTKAIGQLKALIVGAPKHCATSCAGAPPTPSSTAAHGCEPCPATPGAPRHRAGIRAVARRALFLEAEAAEHETDIEALVVQACPALLDRPGIGALTAARLLIAWSHPGRIRNEAASPPSPACHPSPPAAAKPALPAQPQRRPAAQPSPAHRHLSRLQHHDPTKAYAQKEPPRARPPERSNAASSALVAREPYRLMEKHAKTLKDINKVA